MPTPELSIAKLAEVAAGIQKLLQAEHDIAKEHSDAVTDLLARASNDIQQAINSASVSIKASMTKCMSDTDAALSVAASGIELTLNSVVKAFTEEMASRASTISGIMGTTTEPTPEPAPAPQPEPVPQPEAANANL